MEVFLANNKSELVSQYLQLVTLPKLSIKAANIERRTSIGKLIMLLKNFSE